MVSSPLRYPGGKAKLFPYFSELIIQNNLYNSEYCEPYAGGAGLALKLLSHGFVERISLNDIDSSISSFWKSVLHHTDEFCELILETPITVNEWHRQKVIWEKNDTRDPVSLGFALFFLNRTNRSGIIEGAGPIGGYAQKGKWKIDVRFTKDKQISNIQSISKLSDKIEIQNEDALVFVQRKLSVKHSFIYLDPPYYIKGKKLYKNFYSHDDHQKIATLLESHREQRWVVSYDDVPEIRGIYENFAPIMYGLNYSAGRKGIGQEVIYTSDQINPPEKRGFKSAA